MSTVQPPVVGTSHFSDDGKWWWDGGQWQPAVSADGKYRWTGLRWVPVRRMLFGDYANQSIVCAPIGILCGIVWILGLIAGIQAYREIPWKRTQAIVGIVLNSVGCGLLVLGVISRIVVAASHG